MNSGAMKMHVACLFHVSHYGDQVLSFSINSRAVSLKPLPTASSVRTAFSSFLFLLFYSSRYLPE